MRPHAVRKRQGSEHAAWRGTSSISTALRVHSSNWEMSSQSAIAKANPIAPAWSVG